MWCSFSLFWFSGSNVAMGDDATTTEKDGFSAGESIVWKFEDNSGNQYNLNPVQMMFMH